MLKRVFDVVGAGIGLFVLFPIWIGIACGVKLDSPGPVFFFQTRLGKGGKPFTLVKFRTMHILTEKVLDEHFEANPEARLTWMQLQKLMDDPRLTRVGRVLRRLSLDELPQLWNIFCGDMSWVGPRPCLPEQQNYYGDAFEYYAAVRPGLTGLWQVSGRNQLSFAERVVLDVRYVREWSWALDLKILVQTIGVVLKRDGAF